MSDTNYPDILGYITGGARYNVNVAQIALAVRPRIVRAGRTFEAILLIQNASDVNVDVTASLQLPRDDAQKKPDRFIIKSERLLVGLRPAEVGYVTLPITSLPDTAVSDAYKLAMTVDVKPLKKPQRIRLPEGGGEVITEYLDNGILDRLSDLKRLTYSTNRRGIVGATLEASFNVLSSQIGQIVDLRPDWISLWRMSNYRDDRMLLRQYGDLLRDKVLAHISRAETYQPLLDETLRRFQAAQYDLQPIEAHYITKFLVLLLELGATTEDAYDPLSHERYNVRLHLKKDADLSALPAWCRGMLKAIDAAPATADAPVEALCSTVYDELLRDAIQHGFDLIQKMTGEDMGSPDEIRDYTDKLIRRLLKAEALSLADVYLPLVMSGVLAYDRVLQPDETIGDNLKALSDTVKARRSEVDSQTEIVWSMAAQLVDRTLQKYGYRT